MSIIVPPGKPTVIVRGQPQTITVGRPINRGVVVAEPGKVVTPAALRAWCKERLTGYKVPREFYVVDELPKSMLGKVLRKQVRDELDAKTPLVHG